MKNGVITFFSLSLVIIFVLIVTFMLLFVMYFEGKPSAKLTVKNESNESICIFIAKDSSHYCIVDGLYEVTILKSAESSKPTMGRELSGESEFLRSLFESRDSSIYLLAYSTDTLKKILKSNYNYSFNYLADLDPQLNLKAFIEMKNKKRVYYKKLTYKEMNESDWSFIFDDSMCVWRD